MSQLPGPNASSDAIRHQLAQPLADERPALQPATVTAMEAEIVNLRARVTALEELARVALTHVRNGMPIAAAAELERMMAEAERSA